MHRSFFLLFSPQYLPADDFQFALLDRVAGGIVGGVGVRADGDDLSSPQQRRTNGGGRRATRVVLHGAARNRHGSRRADRAVARGLAGRQVHAGNFLRAHDGVRSGSRSATSSTWQRVPLAWFMVCSFLLGLGGANFIVYSFWLPEQYGTECRASAFAFITNVGRFAAAGFTFLVGAGIRHFQKLGTPVALTALAFVVGLCCCPSAWRPRASLCLHRRRGLAAG